MKFIIFSLVIVCFSGIVFSKDNVLTGKDASMKIKGAETIRLKNQSDIPSYVKFRKGEEIEKPAFFSWFINNNFKNQNIRFQFLQKENDRYGMEHSRYQLLYHNTPVAYAILVLHTLDNKVASFNCDLSRYTSASVNVTLDKEEALAKALEYFPAEKYKWQLPSEEAFLKKIKNDGEATFYPEAKKIFFVKGPELRIAWYFDIYAHEPWKRAELYIDATTGEKLYENNLIKNTDVPGVAVTKYSGTQNITSDSIAGLYRLRETGRGNGIETYDMNMGSDYGAAVDFTDPDNYWDNVNTEQDEVAADAHWGAERTYDYYFEKHGRNSIDNTGFALLSYVHADLTGFGLPNNSNAFWDGNVMTYGDGNQYPFTALDICGHEITHGLVTFTANLNSGAEPGALNEGFADIFGTCIEFFSKPSVATWTMGNDINMIIRDMANPSATNDPDTYLGPNWDFATQEVHQNSTVLSHWFYLVSEGGSGTNGIGNTYAVAGISLDSAAIIAYRTLTTYLTPSSDYADTRYYSIQSAIDLFGACSPEVESVTNAWYAVGIGNAYVPAVVSAFSADFTAFCAAPATVQFTNQSSNGTSFTWDFGDGVIGYTANPNHVYTSGGLYTVTLVTDGGSCGTDTLAVYDFISINPANPCIVILPQTGSDIVTYCSGTLFDSGGQENYQDNTDVSVTIAPTGASQVILNFTTFNFETGYDYLYIYNGPDITSPLIGQYDGASLPNGGTVISDFGSVTIRQTTDQGLTMPGFELSWVCQMPDSPPVANFTSDVNESCTGEITFSDYSTNNPDNLLWDFGDGATDTSSQPTHYYTSSGTFSVTLVATNAFGSDTIIKNNFVTVNLPASPLVTDDTTCIGSYAVLTATASGTINWYDSQTGGSLLFTGQQFTTSALNATTVYYAENELVQAAQYVGKADNSGTGGYYTNTTEHYLVFDAVAPLTLVSVKVYAGDAGQRTINLKSSQGTILQAVTANIPLGESRVTLNFNIPAGTNYQLAVSPANCNLYRNGSQQGADLPYPYEIPGLVQIKNNSAGNLKYYYYFYDWEVAGQTCTSARTPVTAYVEVCAGIEETREPNSISVYPNPVNDILYLQTGSLTLPLMVTICNVNGGEIRKIRMDDNARPVIITDLPDGVYYLKVLYLDHPEILKFCVVH